MPTVLDATVVNSAYETSKTARPQLLPDGSVLEVVHHAGTGFKIYKTDTAGISTYLGYMGFNNGGSQAYWTIAVKNGYLHIMATHSTYSIVMHRSVKISDLNGGDIQSLPSYKVSSADTGQTAFNGIDCIINGNYIELSESSKNTTYSVSFNIRYAKGTINADGSVAWSAVEQVTTVSTSGTDFINSVSILLDANSIPTIIAGTTGAINSGNTGISATTSNNSVMVVKRNTTLVSQASYINSNWSYKHVYYVGAYNQSSPSAIFVPQSVNGLANGRIWVAWHGASSTATNSNIFASYSDDGGATWATKIDVTTGNDAQYKPSITANKRNEIYVLWFGVDAVISANRANIRKRKWSNDTWGAIQTVTNDTAGDVRDPSALFDNSFSLNFSEPLFVYDKTTTVNFYGTWTTVEISVTPGALGTKTDRANLLTYSITTDGTMSAITEKVNGVTIGTKTATSGAPLIAGLTQAQWDAVRFGKYADATGGKNTLTIEMGDDVWTYTFDKRPATDADILSAVKAVKDSQEVYLPSIKRQLVDKVGGNVADSFEAIIGGAVMGRKMASGTATAGGTTKVFKQAGSTNTFNTYFITVSGISFKPKTIIVSRDNAFLCVYSKSMLFGGGTMNEFNTIYTNTVNTFSSSRTMYGLSVDDADVTSSSFLLPVEGSFTFNWIAYE